MKSLHVGIVGAGQLGRMLALAGYPLGVQCLFLDRSADAPGAQVAPILVGDLTDPERLEELAARSDVVTFDWENIPGSALQPLEKTTRIRPPRAALEASQDRLVEKALFSKLKIPVAAHAAIDSKQQLLQATANIGLPGVLKTRRLGYDGKGQFVLHDAAHIDAAWTAIGGSGPDLRGVSGSSRARFPSSARAPPPGGRFSIHCPPILTQAAFCAFVLRL